MEDLTSLQKKYAEEEYRRLFYVAMTRAKKKLIVIGDSATLSSLKFYKDFIQYAEETQGYKSVWELE